MSSIFNVGVPDVLYFYININPVILLKSDHRVDGWVALLLHNKKVRPRASHCGVSLGILV